MGGLPTGHRAENADVLRHRRKHGKVTLRKEQTAVLPDIRIARVPRSVFRIKGVDVTGTTRQVDEDAGAGRATRRNQSRAHCRIGRSSQQCGADRSDAAEKKMPAGERVLAAALLGHGSSLIIENKIALLQNGPLHLGEPVQTIALPFAKYGRHLRVRWHTCERR